MSRQPPPAILPNSERAKAMDRARAKEIASASAFSHVKGYFSTRVTRAYSIQDKIKQNGMTVDTLRRIGVCGGKDIPIYIEHKHNTVMGRTLSAHFNEDDQFLYIRGIIDQNSELAKRRSKGELPYVSVCFTLPTANDDPMQHESSIFEVSFVERPHEPYAQVLVSHNTTDTAPQTQIVTVCSPLSPMAAAAPQPDVAPQVDTKALLEQIRVLKEEHETMATTVKQWQERHTSAQKPHLERISGYISANDRLAEDEKNVANEIINTAASDPRGAGFVSLFSEIIQKYEETTKAREQAPVAPVQSGANELLRAQQIPLQAHSASHVGQPIDVAQRIAAVLKRKSEEAYGTANIPKTQL